MPLVAFVVILCACVFRLFAGFCLFFGKRALTNTLFKLMLFFVSRGVSVPALHFVLKMGTHIHRKFVLSICGRKISVHP